MFIQNMQLEGIKTQFDPYIVPAFTNLGGFGTTITNVNIIDGGYFNNTDSASQDTSVSDLGTEYDTYAMVWIMGYAHRDIVFNSLFKVRSYEAYNTSTHSGTAKIRTAVTESTDDPRFWGSRSIVRAAATTNFTTVLQLVPSTTNIFANKFFIVGLNGPRTRTYKQVNANRTVWSTIDNQAVTSSNPLLPWVTYINKCWWTPLENTEDDGNLPIQIGNTIYGNTSSSYTQIDGYVPWYSLYLRKY
ncbi:MAG: hypothetical protein EB127_27260 [Alphaproteobacteria bacterium]|nr:hypothetical protein [Alphaproteobacteria bacterium]